MILIVCGVTVLTLWVHVACVHVRVFAFMCEMCVSFIHIMHNMSHSVYDNNVNLRFNFHCT